VSWGIPHGTIHKLNRYSPECVEGEFREVYRP
jgi:hypothetical protein